MRTKSCYLLVGIAILMIIFGISQAYAQKVDLKARVGKYYFSISGYASPFGLVTMKSNSVTIASTIADPKGNFLMEKVSVNEGFSKFCLEAVDIKKIGDTSTCFNIAPVTKDTKLAEKRMAVVKFLWNLLAMSGFAPETAKCINCRQEKEEGYFSFEGGGFLCDNCRQRDLFSLPLDRDSLRQLRQQEFLVSDSLSKLVIKFWQKVVDHAELRSLTTWQML